MSERRLLALLALLLGLLGALLVLLNFHFPRQGEDVVRWIGEYAVRIILALVAIGGAPLMYGGEQQAGGGHKNHRRDRAPPRLRLGAVGPVAHHLQRHPRPRRGG